MKGGYIRVIFDFQVGLAWHQQVIDRFVVDLHVGHPHIVIVVVSILEGIFKGSITYIFNAVENVSDRARQNTWDVLGTQHGIGFTRGRLTIHKNSSIIALECCFCDGSYNRLINLRSFAIRAKDIIKLETLGLHSVLVTPP